MIDIIAPSELLSNGGIWNDTTWMQLDVDRVDFTINNDVNVYNLIDEETKLAQFKASVHQLIITGHINADSDLVGANAFTKTKNLILAMRQWYVDLQATDMTTGDCGYPQVKWNNKTWNFLLQKVMIIDNADDSGSTNKIFNYQISCIIAHNEDDV